MVLEGPKMWILYVKLLILRPWFSFQVQENSKSKWENVEILFIDFPFILQFLLLTICSSIFGGRITRKWGNSFAILRLEWICLLRRYRMLSVWRWSGLILMQTLTFIEEVIVSIFLYNNPDISCNPFLLTIGYPAKANIREKLLEKRRRKTNG